VTTEPTPAKGIRVSSAVITGMEDKEDMEVKDDYDLRYYGVVVYNPEVVYEH
jgi:hypothetical protein